jgi:hypothetical protein
MYLNLMYFSFTMMLSAKKFSKNYINLTVQNPNDLKKTSKKLSER